MADAIQEFIFPVAYATIFGFDQPGDEPMSDEDKAAALDQNQRAEEFYLSKTLPNIYIQQSGLGSGTIDPAQIASGTPGAGKAPVGNPPAWTDIATQTELDAHINDTIAHAASAVSFDDTGTLILVGQTDVQAALIQTDFYLNYLYAQETLPVNEHYADQGNVTTGETDLYSDSFGMGRVLDVDGAKIRAEYGGVFVSSGTATRRIKVYYGGTAIFDSGALTVSLSAAWDVHVFIIRESSSVVRAKVTMATEGAALAAYTSYTRVTGLDFTGSNILKITGQAGGVGAASNDIVAKLGNIEIVPAS